MIRKPLRTLTAATSLALAACAHSSPLLDGASMTNASGKTVTDRQPVKGTAWRFAPWLFTPPTASLRADPRFLAICDAAGLSEYWAKRGIKPDYQLGIT